MVRTLASHAGSRGSTPLCSTKKSKAIIKIMWYVYILKSQKDNSFYTGMSENVEQRLQQHNAGKSKYTNGHRPFELVYTEFVGSREEARKREKYLKSSAGKRFIGKIIDR